MPSPAAPACPLTVIAWRLSSLGVPALWWRYVELGGNLPRVALVDYLSGTAAWPTSEHNVLAQALNECLWDGGHPSVAPYRELESQRSTPAGIEGSAELP